VARAPVARVIASGEGWSIRELACCPGPQDRPYEERHERTTIAAVIEGTFQYRTAAGTALAYPGAFLLGNAGTVFECAHTHGVGDRCVAFDFDPSFFEEVASAVAGSYRFRFPAAILPASPKLAPAALESVLSTSSQSLLAADELAIRLVETVIGASVGST
jgi:AraC family transcriptional regulator